jgi:hypothetical protein
MMRRNWVMSTTSNQARRLSLDFKAIRHISCDYTHFGDSIRLLRRLLSILLLAVFGLPVVSPLFALSTTEATRLPACCRRDGKHHCMASMADRDNLTRRGTQFGAPAEKCPYCPSALAATHKELLALPIGDAVFASLIGHPSGVAETESMRRISPDRSRQKRGPPVLSSLA